jgi:carbon starvation protein
MSRGRNPLAAIIPLVFLLAMTTWALFIQLGEFFNEGAWLLLIVDAIVFVLAVWLIVESASAMNRVRNMNRNSGGGSDNTPSPRE